MSFRDMPRRVRVNLVLHWVGIVLAGLGVIAFFLSFGQVASVAQARIDVHDEMPVIAYAGILAWALGLGLMWYSRRTLDFEMRKKMKKDRSAMRVDLGDAGGDAPAADTDA